MAEKKTSAFALLRILKKYSDEDHILSARQIIDMLDEFYGIRIERRTLYSNIEMLEQDGYVISRYEDNGRGYYLKQRQFDKAEVLLLCNAVHASHFISASQSDNIIRKLLDTQSSHQAREFKDSVYLPNRQKTNNTQLLQNIARVSEAIRDSHPVSFTYLRYNTRKQLEPRRHLPYEVEPRYIVYADSRAYMIVTSDSHPGFAHYRLDRMQDVRVLDGHVRPLSRDLDAYEYARNKLFMYAGEMQWVTFLCQARIMDHMIDLFGPEVMIITRSDEQFTIRVNTSTRGAMFLAQQYMDSMEILEPESLRQEFIRQVQNTMKRYEQK